MVSNKITNIMILVIIAALFGVLNSELNSELAEAIMAVVFLIVILTLLDVVFELLRSLSRCISIGRDGIKFGKIEEKVTEPKCNHDFVYIDKWQDAKKTYWEFHCRYCLELVIRNDKNR